jgi:hypothetical protein
MITRGRKKRKKIEDKLWEIRDICPVLIIAKF